MRGPGRNNVGDRAAYWLRDEASKTTSFKDAGAKFGVTGTAVQLAWKRLRFESRPIGHGHTVHRLRSATYNSWRAMIDRCTQPSHTEWENYGGRGIQVCERWRLFENFLVDMGERPDGTTIDRERNDEGYHPGNCRWIDGGAQARNRRSTKLTPDKVRKIRRLVAEGKTQREAGECFGVSQCHVSAIIRGQKWSDV